MTTAARRDGTITADNRADFDRLVSALPFDPMHPPQAGGDGLVMHLARVFDLAAVTRAHAEGVPLLDGDAGDEQIAARLAGVAWHSMRHTHATNLGTDPSVDAVTLSQRLGHADPAFTARRYVHGREDRARELARIAAGLA